MSKNKLLIFSLSVISVIVLSFAALGGLFAYSLNQTSKPANLLESFITDLNQSNYQSAYSKITDDFANSLLSRCALPTLELINTSIEEYCFRQFVQTNEFEKIQLERVNVFGVKIIPWNNRVLDNEKAYFDGSFKFGSNDNRKDIKVILIKSGEDWKISEFRLKN